MFPCRLLLKTQLIIAILSLLLLCKCFSRISAFYNFLLFDESREDVPQIENVNFKMKNKFTYHLQHYDQRNLKLTT